LIYPHCRVIDLWNRELIIRDVITIKFMGTQNMAGKKKAKKKAKKK